MKGGIYRSRWKSHRSRELLIDKAIRVLIAALKSYIVMNLVIDIIS